MSIIYNALSGAMAAQAALATTSQNVANVMTPGYTRQGVLLASVQPLQSGALSAGSGVKVPALLRFSDGYKSLQLWNAASELGQRTTAQPYLTQLEQVMGDEQSGINSGLDAFFSALNAASVDPTSSPLRQQVITSADALAQRFNSLTQLLSNQRAAVVQQRQTTITQVNGLSKDIAELNRQIAATQGTGVNPSALIDARDNKIDELSGLVALQVVEQADGTRSISLRGGQPLVVGARAATMSAVTNPDGSQTLQVGFANETFILSKTGLGGELGGLEDYEANTLVPMIQSISDMAEQLADAVNTQLAAGFKPDGTAGTPLFEFDASTSTGTLRVTSGILASDLAFSADATAPGNSDNLLELIDIRTQSVTLTGLGSVSLADASTQLVAKLGMTSQQNQAAMDTAQTVRNQAEESWKSTSGVNTDEEAINLMQYQQMYQANMKVIAVANELFDSTLALLG
ncbi:flagellar hook-associated protein FlgK [Steroidobacter sp.]|uniref:flagellar hook-associated protein FlgK n=1 Tax=Steroidobacter sp. TaxID=1978227 RepID=UPI001A5D46E9|nr:flagellar hook-associated protein FlgK [Steroidobacter sp.]MBL8265492.1 flagellar hook-associated protein FlgK [Steroidobacter sp.]